MFMHARTSTAGCENQENRAHKWQDLRMRRVNHQASRTEMNDAKTHVAVRCWILLGQPPCDNAQSRMGVS
jgi:hypothetical protein